MRHYKPCADCGVPVLDYYNKKRCSPCADSVREAKIRARYHRKKYALAAARAEKRAAARVLEGASQ